jgi:hypothetical protein
MLNHRPIRPHILLEQIFFPHHRVRSKQLHSTGPGILRHAYKGTGTRFRSGHRRDLVPEHLHPPETPYTGIQHYKNVIPCHVAELTPAH